MHSASFDKFDGKTAVKHGKTTCANSSTFHSYPFFHISFQYPTQEKNNQEQPRTTKNNQEQPRTTKNNQEQPTRINEGLCDLAFVFVVLGGSYTFFRADLFINLIKFDKI